MLASIPCCLNEPKPKNDQEVIDNTYGEWDSTTTIEQRQTEVEEINIKALAWADTLDVDPIQLSKEMGIKGKKKFVELLDIYLCLYQTTDDPLKKEEYKQKVEELVMVTKDKRYHDLNNIDDTQFRQNSTSYLRAWYIINEFGINTSYYVEEIERVLPRINSHLPGRGINKKFAFVLYYHKLCYTIDYNMEDLFNSSVIRSQMEILNLSELDVYFITHEIFFLNDDNKINILTSDDFEYLTKTLVYQVNKTIAEENVDLLAELIMIMTYLNFKEMDEYYDALNFIKGRQNKNGSFGYYEDARRYYHEIGSKIDVDIYLYLHTTEVTLRALNEAVFN